ncbi:alpha/beta hydrolase, partial [Burkholderia anthina]
MNDRTGVLLIHGLGGTRHDLGSMHKAIRRAGGDAHMITLPGHGTRPEDLAEVRAEAWL